MSNELKRSAIMVAIANTKTGENDWIDLPLGKGTYSLDALKNLEIKGKHYEICGASFQGHNVACECICNAKSIDEVNWFARLYYALDDEGKESFRCLTESRCARCESVKDLINLVLTDSIPAGNYGELFAYYNYTNERKCPIALSANEPVPQEYFSVLGRCIASKENGKFFENNYFGKRRNVTIEEAYKGAFDEIPEEFRVRF